MNDRADLAMAAGADGVHLGQDDIMVSDARRILGAAKLVGVSTHNIQQARNAVMEGANYIGVGPIFPSNTKSFDSFPGLEFAKQVASEIKLPAYAIGGIGSRNIGDVLRTGIRFIAARNSVISKPDPFVAATELMSKMS